MTKIWRSQRSALAFRQKMTPVIGPCFASKAPYDHRLHGRRYYVFTDTKRHYLRNPAVCRRCTMGHFHTTNAEISVSCCAHDECGRLIPLYRSAFEDINGLEQNAVYTILICVLVL